MINQNFQNYYHCRETIKYCRSANQPEYSWSLVYYPSCFGSCATLLEAQAAIEKALTWLVHIQIGINSIEGDYYRDLLNLRHVIGLHNGPLFDYRYLGYRAIGDRVYEVEIRPGNIRFISLTGQLNTFNSRPIQRVQLGQVIGYPPDEMCSASIGTVSQRFRRAAWFRADVRAYNWLIEQAEKAYTENQWEPQCTV